MVVYNTNSTTPNRLDVPSRLKGIETLAARYSVQPGIFCLDVPSRLKGIEIIGGTQHHQGQRRNNMTYHALLETIRLTLSLTGI